MKILLYFFIVLSVSNNVYYQSSNEEKLSKDILKAEIKQFEKMVFDLPINNQIDTTATYVSIYKIENYSNLKNGRNCRKKDYSYLKLEKDTILGKDLLKESKVIFTSHIHSKNEETFKKLESYNLSVPLRYLIEFDNRFLLIRTASVITTGEHESINTGNYSATHPSQLFEKYTYYKRVN